MLRHVLKEAQTLSLFWFYTGCEQQSPGESLSLCMLYKVTFSYPMIKERHSTYWFADNNAETETYSKMP